MITALLTAALSLQQPDALAKRVEQAGRSTYGLERTGIPDLEIRLRGSWGALELADLNRRIYWLNTGSVKERSWNSGRSSRGLTAAERSARLTLDRVVWSFLSNRTDEQAIEELRRPGEPPPELKTEKEETRVAWKHPVAKAEMAGWFDAEGRLTRASGTTVTMEAGTILDELAWSDAYVYERHDETWYLKTLRLEGGELTAEWEEVGGVRLPIRIAGDLKGVGEVRIDLSARAIDEGRAAAVHAQRGR